jgi:hypothetical protein
MSTINELNFNITYYIDNETKILRVPCNFLLSNNPLWTVNKFIHPPGLDSNYYTHVSIDYQGTVLLKTEISNLTKLKNKSLSSLLNKS